MCIRDRYENRTHGGVRGRELVAPSYSIGKFGAALQNRVQRKIPFSG